jgi:hypothetical protein
MAAFMGTPSPVREELATAVVDAVAFMGTCPDGRWIARAGAKSNEWAALPARHAQGRENPGITWLCGVDGQVTRHLSFRFYIIADSAFFIAHLPH